MFASRRSELALMLLWLGSRNTISSSTPVAATLVRVFYEFSWFFVFRWPPNPRLGEQVRHASLQVIGYKRVGRKETSVWRLCQVLMPDFSCRIESNRNRSPCDTCFHFRDSNGADFASHTVHVIAYKRRRCHEIHRSRHHFTFFFVYASVSPSLRSSLGPTIVSLSLRFAFHLINISQQFFFHKFSA